VQAYITAVMLYRHIIGIYTCGDWGERMEGGEGGKREDGKEV